MNYEIVVADPAKNITVFVLSPAEDRAAAARKLLADSELKAEQVGFVIPPARDKGIWRLEMMGGEFCGNAARSFGLFAAREQGLSGEQTVVISMSGVEKNLPVKVHVEEGWAAVEVPGPLAVETLDLEGRALRVYVFDGITHVIAPDLSPDEKICARIRAGIEGAFGRSSAGPPDSLGQPGSLRQPLAAGQPDSLRQPPAALGVLFYDTAAAFMRPAVYVYDTDSLVFESSCGSGSAALAVWKTGNAGDGETVCAVRQPGGIIDVRVRRRNGGICGLSIGGTVSLSGRMYRCYG
jgi:diaminopimelate epimerase